MGELSGQQLLVANALRGLVADFVDFDVALCKGTVESCRSHFQAQGADRKYMALADAMDLVVASAEGIQVIMESLEAEEE